MNKPDTSQVLPHQRAAEITPRPGNPSGWAALEQAMRAIAREEALRVLRSAPPASLADDFLTLEQAAALAHVSLSTIKTWLRRGDLKRWGEGRAVRVRRDELVAYLAPKQTERVASNAEVSAKATELLGRNR